MGKADNVIKKRWDVILRNVIKAKLPKLLIFWVQPEMTHSVPTTPLKDFEKYLQFVDPLIVALTIVNHPNVKTLFVQLQSHIAANNFRILAHLSGGHDKFGRIAHQTGNEHHWFATRIGYSMQLHDVAIIGGHWVNLTGKAS